MELRRHFPVLERVAYLNAGTDGPVASAAVDAARAALDDELSVGRWRPHFEARMELGARLREGYARVLGTDPANVALTTSTTDGIARVIAGMDLRAGDEIVTSDSEHPGLVGSLVVARERGVEIREVPMAGLADAVGPRTRLVACSHVSWVDGQEAPSALRDVGVPVLFDGAQGVGAVPLDMDALGCAAYAGAGQKWLCGADGTGMLYLSPAFRDSLRVVAPSYMTFTDHGHGPMHPDARRFDTPSLSRESLALSLAALEVLEDAGLPAVHEHAAALAETFAERIAATGRTVAPRGRTTLVSWEDPDAEGVRDRCSDAGVVIRNLPGTPYLRASVGAWNDESDLDRLLAALR
jgi:selenocysteine lyase/cysteine desulfurase